MQNPALLIFNLGTFEIVFIVFMILMFFGSESIPKIAQGLGKGMRQMRDAANEIKEDILESAGNVDNEVKTHTKEIEDSLKDDKDA